MINCLMEVCQEAFNRRLPLCCYGSVRKPLALINSWIFRNLEERHVFPSPGLRNPGISFISFSLWWKVPSSLFNRDRLVFCKSGILIFIFAENNYSIYAHAMLIKTPLLHQSFGPRVFLSFFLSLSLLFLDDFLEHGSWLCNPGNIRLFTSFTLSSSTLDHQVPVH